MIKMKGTLKIWLNNYFIEVNFTQFILVPLGFFGHASQLNKVTVTFSEYFVESQS